MREFIVPLITKVKLLNLELMQNEGFIFMNICVEYRLNGVSRVVEKADAVMGSLYWCRNEFLYFNLRIADGNGH